MNIIDGFDSRVLEIRVSARQVDKFGRKADVWIEFHAPPKEETLSIATLEELLALRDELNSVIQELVK